MDFTGYISSVQAEWDLPPWLTDWTSLTPRMAGSSVHLIHAPPGCDQGALADLLITTAAETHCWYWFTPAKCGSRRDAFDDSTALLSAIDQLLDQANGYLCLFVDRPNSEDFPWEAVLDRFAGGAIPVTLLVFSHHVPLRILDWSEGRTTRQWVNVIHADALAYSQADLETLAKKLGATSPATLAACVHSVARGWPWISKHLLWRFRQGPFDHIEALSAAVNLCRKSGAFPTDEDLDLFAFLHFAEAVPAAVFSEKGPLNNYSALYARGLENGWLLRRTDGTSAVITAALLGPLLGGREIITRYPACLASVARWLEENGYQAKALNLWLALGCWDEAEQVLLDIGDQYIAVLDVAPVIEWLDRLDAGRPVEHPLLLVSFIRCGVYEGSELKVTRYFARLIEQLEARGAAYYRAYLGETRWRRLMAEVQLYSLVTGLGADNPVIVDMLRGLEQGTSPAALMQEAYQHVLDGRLADLLPVLCAGLKQTRQQGMWPYHTIFSIFNFWALMLSGRRVMALSFLGETRRLLAENQVSFTGAYEWLDVLELLAARLGGELGYCRGRVSQLIDDHRYFSDNLKCHVLLSLQCEMALSGHDLSRANTVLDELILRRKSAAGRSYWLPSALVMQRSIALLSRDRPNMARGEQEAEKAGNEIQAQTETLWSLKMDLQQGLLEGVETRLKALRQRCVEQGQWLRLIETRLLLAVYLLRTGQQREAFRKFTDVVEKLIDGEMTGVLLDPFLLWLPFMEQRLPPGQNQALERLISQIPDTVRNLASKQVKLTSREHQVLSLLVKGMANQAIADALSVSVTTVRTHLQNIYNKLDVSNRAAATARAIEQGIV